jgi:hypothetical protein
LAPNVRPPRPPASWNVGPARPPFAVWASTITAHLAWRACSSIRRAPSRATVSLCASWTVLELGHVRQLDRVSRELLRRAFAAGAGPGAGPLTINIDSTVCETYGLAKQGATGFTYTRVRGYHPLLAVAAGTGDVLHARLRGGSANTIRAPRALSPRRSPGEERGRDGTAHAARGLGLLRARCHRGPPPARRPVLGHSAHPGRCPAVDRGDPRGRLDPDPVLRSRAGRTSPRSATPRSATTAGRRPSRSG